jgi:glycosyltransferase involved in cell wall biosynthesis
MKVLFITTISNTFNSFLTSHASVFRQLGYEVYLGCNEILKVETEHLSNKENFFNLSFSRNPFALSNFLATKKLIKIFNCHKFDIIYTHTPTASFFSRLGLFFKKTKFVYFIHGFHFHKKSSILSWLLYFPLEFILSFFTYAAITINKEDFYIAGRIFKYKKVFNLNGVGIELTKFSPVNNYLLNTICSVGELNNNKNHIAVIKTFFKFPELQKFTYLIAGSGPLMNVYKKIIIKYNLNNIFLLGYQKDINNFLNGCSILIHPSKREGLSVSPIEAMAKSIPVISTNIRGLNDYIVNNHTGLLVNKNPLSIKQAILKVFSNKDFYNYLSEKSVFTSMSYSNDLVLPNLKKIIIEVGKAKC